MKNKIQKKKGAIPIIVMLIVMVISASTATLVFGGMGDKSKEAGSKVSNILEGDEVIPPVGGDGGDVIVPEVPVVEEVVIPASAENVDPVLEGYTFNTSTKAITKYTGTNKDIVIPKSFLINGISYDVLKISGNAFSNAGLTSVVIPSHIQTIGSGAFTANIFTGKVILDSTLTAAPDAFLSSTIGDNLYITSNVTKIPASAFKGAKISKLVLPSSLTSLGDYCFNNNRITSVDIPESVTYFGISSFESNLITEFIVPDNLIDIPNNFMKYNKLRKLVITENVKTIGDYAFAGNPLDIQVILNANITTAGSSYTLCPFSGASMGASLLITDKVTTIPDFIFAHAGITSYNLPNSVTAIGKFAFSFNKLLTAPVTPYVTTWGPCVYHDNLITEFIIPDYMTAIPDSFLSLNKLTKITIPSHVISIGSHAFQLNNFTKGVVINSNLPGNFTNALPIVGFSRATISSVQFGPNVTRIPDRFFYETTFTYNITLPSNIVNIGSYSFYRASFPSSIRFNNAVGDITMGTYAFLGCTAQKVYLK